MVHPSPEGLRRQEERGGHAAQGARLSRFHDETVDELMRLDGRVRVPSDGEVHVL
jgi:hypothetical protein